VAITLPRLSEAQFEVMNIVWELGECTVADVLDRLSQNRDLARNTVQTMLSRLDEKGWLRHRELRGKFLYAATFSRQEVQQEYLDGVVNSVFNGSAEGLLLTLLQNRSLSRDEAARIRKIIQEAEKRL